MQTHNDACPPLDEITHYTTARLRQSLLIGSHTHHDGHLEEIIGGPKIRPRKRNGLARIARHGHTNEIAISDNGIGRIQLHPAGARQVDLAPSVG